MKRKSFSKDLYAIIPLLFSGLLCIFLIFLLWQKSNTNEGFVLQLNNLTTILIGISAFLAAILMLYLAGSAMFLKKNQAEGLSKGGKIVQQMHNFRAIIEILVNSKMWLPGIKEYIDDEYAGLSFFDMKEFYKGKSKLAIEYHQDNNKFGETENLYLEFKSLLMTHPRERKLPENIEYPQMYSKEILGKWLEHKCSSGLWYFFGYKYGEFKGALDLDAVFERHQEKVMTLALGIDKETFEDSSFNEIFFARLGEYMSNNVIPQLYQMKQKTASGISPLFRYLYMVFVLFVFFGVLLPLLYLLFQLPIITIIVGFSFIISLLFFVATTFYQFLSREIKG